MATVFERLIGSLSGTEDVYINLESDRDIRVDQIIPMSIKIAEEFSLATPIVSVQFRGNLENYTDLVKISPSTNFTLGIGTGVDNYKTIDLQVAYISLSNEILGKFQDVYFKIDFYCPQWNEFMNIRRNKGWSNIGLHDVVKEIADESGFNNKTVTNIPNTRDFVIQPYWSNYQMIKWIQKETASEYQDHCEFLVKLDGTFHFRSISELINNQLVGSGAVIPKLRLEGPNLNDEVKRESKRQNNNIPTYFVQYSSNEFHASSVLNGSGGFNAMWYDFNEGEYHNEEVRFSDSDQYQLTDWGPIQEVHEQSNAPFYGGRNLNTENKAFSKISNVAISTNKSNIQMEGSINVEAGDIIEIIIPSYGFGEEDPINVTRSGYYMVSGVQHDIPLNKQNQFTTKLTIVRHGFDGKELEGYIRSNQGKTVNS